MAVDDQGALSARHVPPQSRELRAGPLTVLLEGTDLRRVRAGRSELVQRLYVAVRDAVWGTVPPVLSAYEVSDAGDAFRVRYQARFAQDDVDFSAWITYEGRSDGTLRAELEGLANTDFSYCRIGFCLLHGLNYVGRPYRARTPEGEQEGTLPTLVGAQRLIDGKLHPLFPSFQHLEIDLPEGVEVRFDFEGDLFETEDQRNWTDASFKTYSTPITLGFPHHAVHGQTLRQRIEMSASGLPSPGTTPGTAWAWYPAPAAVGTPTIALGGALRTGLPSIGFGMSSIGEEIRDRAAQLLRAARPTHLRADLHLDDPSLPQVAAAAARAASRLNTGIEFALFLSDDVAGELEQLAPLLRDLPIRRFLIFRAEAPCSDGRLAGAVKERLGSEHPDAQYAAGTNVYFSDLNRFRPDMAGADAVVFPVVPTVHAVDDLSLIENLQGQVDVVRTAREIGGNLPVVVSPVTIKPRFNPFASGEEEVAVGVARERPLPAAVDPRQATLFGAIWTLGSLKYLTEAGAPSVTYYETVGWRGLIEGGNGSLLPEAFSSRPGMVFPLYWVFADLAEWQDAEVAACTSSDPETVIGLAVRRGDRTRVLIGNLTTSAQRVSIGLEGAGEMTVRYLDDRSFEAATSGHADGRAPQQTSRELELGPYAMACIDARGR